MPKKNDAPAAGQTPLDVALKLPPGQLANLLASMLESEKAPTLEDLRGTTAFLDVLAELPPDELASKGYKFVVYVMDRGPRAFLPDSDWNETVPTEGAIAERYGPGLYRVEVRCRRKGQGGGNAAPITVRIAQPRDPERPAPSSDSARAFDLLERVLEAREDRGDTEAPAAVAPKFELPPEALELLAQIKGGDKDGLPEWVTRLIEKFGAKLIDGDGAKPAGVSTS